MPQTLPGGVLEDNEEEKRPLQENFADVYAGEEDGDREPDSIPARFGWGGARVKGVHSLHTKANQKKFNPGMDTAKHILGSGKMSKNVDCTHVVLEMSEQL
jgi:hypothetical protein